MIKVLVKKNNKQIEEIIISGHALYDALGKDIVCAAVSSITITTINAILSLEDTISYEEDEGLLKIKIIKDTEINNKLLNNMLRMLNELSCQYPKNIEIRNED